LKCLITDRDDLIFLYFQLLGYYIFRSANSQKDAFRKDPNCDEVSFIWNERKLDDTIDLSYLFIYLSCSSIISIILFNISIYHIYSSIIKMSTISIFYLYHMYLYLLSNCLIYPMYLSHLLYLYSISLYVSYVSYLSYLSYLSIYLYRWGIWDIFRLSEGLDYSLVVRSVLTVYFKYQHVYDKWMDMMNRYDRWMDDER
jgi:hypothetical protein